MRATAERVTFFLAFFSTPPPIFPLLLPGSPGFDGVEVCAGAAQKLQARHLQNLQWLVAFASLQKPPHASYA